MNIQTTSDNIDITPSMKALALEKTEKLVSRFSDLPEDLVSVRVVMNKGEAIDTFEVKIEATVSGKVYFVANTDFSLESALVSSVADVLRQYDRARTKEESTNWQESRNMKVYKDDE